MTNQLEISQVERTTDLRAIASLSIALLAISSSGIFIRLSEGEISSNATVFDRVAIATIIFGFGNGFNAFRHKLSDRKLVAQKFDINRQDLLLFFATATFYLANQTLWAWSLTQTTVAISTVLVGLKPLFTCLFAWLILGQRFENKFLIGMIIAIGGICAVGLEDLQIATGKLPGDIAAFLAAICSSAYLLTVEKLRIKFSPKTIIFWCCGLSTLFSLPVFLFFEDKLFPYSITGWVFVIALAIVCQVLGQGLLAYSLKKFSSGFVALVLLLESILVAIAAWIIFGEILTLFDWVAFFAILLGLYLAISSKSTVKE